MDSTVIRTETYIAVIFSLGVCVRFTPVLGDGMWGWDDDMLKRAALQVCEKG